jgi:ABC-type branched-subunit amino acid transport system substrate-binding protein
VLRNLLSARVAIHAIAAVTLACSSASPGHAQSAPVKIGFLMPLTGGSGRLGQMMLEGSTVAVEQINAAGGIGGHPIQLILEDSQALSKTGIDGFRKLVDIDGTNVIITGFTPVVVAIAPLSKESKVYLISASTASPALRGISPYFQSTWMYDDETVRRILPFAQKTLDVRRLAVLTALNDLGESLAASVKQEWQRIGGVLAIEEGHQAHEINFRPSLLKIIAAQPDAIYFTNSNGKQAAQFIRQARDLGYDGYILSFGAFEDPEVLAVGAKAAKTYYTAPPYDPDSRTEQSRTFVDAFKKKFDRVPNIHQANHYDLVVMIKTVAEKLMREGKAVDGETFRAAVTASMAQYEGAGGAYKFNFQDGSAIRSTIVKTVRDGAFVKAADVD